MKKALFLLMVIFGGVASLLAQKYNVVFIESDDQSNQAVGAYGNPNMITPNIDGLAKEGTSFMAAYNMGCWSPAVCIPSRTMLFYGKYLWGSKNITKRNSPKSMPEILGENGYSTYMTGKWHAMGKRPEVLFDSIGTIRAGQLKSYYSDGKHATDVTGDEAVAFIENYKSEAPFFLYVAFNAPHVPRETKQKYYDLYPPENQTLPPSVIEGPLNKNIAYNYTKTPLKKKVMQSRRQQNNAMVTHMDDKIGDILNALKQTGNYENTLVVFTSDHGINFGENGVAGKVCLYEPSVTAPLIIKAPNIPKNKKVGTRVYLQDIYPTLLDVLGIETPAGIDFLNLVPLIRDKKSIRSSIYLAMFDDQRGIISQNRKLILYPKSGDIEYYDLFKDPWETQNLFKEENRKKEILELYTELLKWQSKVGDALNLGSIFSHRIKK